MVDFDPTAPFTLLDDDDDDNKPAAFDESAPFTLLETDEHPFQERIDPPKVQTLPFKFDSQGRRLPDQPEPDAGFDPDGDGYDDAGAAAVGMQRDATGHMGSVAPVSDADQERLGLPPGSFLVLKGARHESFDKAVEAERARGYEVIQWDDGRYYSIRQDQAEPEPVATAEPEPAVEVAPPPARAPLPAEPRQGLVQPKLDAGPLELPGGRVLPGADRLVGEPVDVSERVAGAVTENVRARQTKTLEQFDEIDSKEADGTTSFLDRLFYDNDLVRIYAGASPERRQELRAELAKDRVEDPTQLAKDFSSGAGLLGEALVMESPEQFMGSVAALFRGGDIGLERTPEQQSWMDRLSAQARTAADEFEKAGTPEGDARPFLPGISHKDIRELPRNVGFTLISMSAGISAGLAAFFGTAATGVGIPAAPAVAWTAGTATSGAAAFFMARDSFMVDMRDFLDKQSQQNRGRGMTAGEWEDFKVIYSSAATRHGMWEALPEALSNAAGLGIIRAPIKSVMKLPVFQNAFARFAVKFAAIQATEHTTELITGVGQEGIDVEVGKRKKARSAAQIFKDQAAQVFLLTTVMSGGAAGVSLGVDAARDKLTNPLLAGLDMDRLSPLEEDMLGDVARQSLDPRDQSIYTRPAEFPKTPRAAPQMPPLDMGTPEDVAASPLADVLTGEGPAPAPQVEDDGGEDAALEAAGLPKVGTRVRVEGGGISATGTMSNPYVTPANEFGPASNGLSITMDDGTTLDLPFEALTDSDITITAAEEGEVIREPIVVEPFGPGVQPDLLGGEDVAGEDLSLTQDVADEIARRRLEGETDEEIQEEARDDIVTISEQYNTDPRTMTPTEPGMVQDQTRIARADAILRHFDAPARPPLTEDAAPEDETEPETDPFSDLNDLFGGGQEVGDPIAHGFSAAFAAGRGFKSITQARKFARELVEAHRAANNREGPTPEISAKAVEESIEAGVVLEARRIVAEGTVPHETFDALVDLYQRQPNLGTRTSTSVEQQAYSTPAPLAFVASQKAGIEAGTSVYEPTAGNGMLLIGASPGGVTANELNPSRAANLRAILGGFSTVTEEDATGHAPAESVDVVIANPPFGKVKNDQGVTARFDVADGLPTAYKTTEVDHAIAWRALDAMKDDGRAVLILGGKRGPDEERIARYRSNNGRKFFNSLYQNYNVVESFTLSGDLYTRQGAQWPVDVFVIEGRGQSALDLPMKTAPRLVESWDELKEILDADSVDVAGEPTGPGDGATEQPTDEAPDVGDVQSGPGGEDQPSGSEGEAGDGGADTGGPGTGDQPDATSGEGGADTGGEQRPPDGEAGGPVDIPSEPSGDQAPAGEPGEPGGGESVGPRDSDPEIDDPFGLEQGLDEAFGPDETAAAPPTDEFGLEQGLDEAFGPEETAAAPDQRPTSEVATSAATSAAGGSVDAIAGLANLFGAGTGQGRVGAGPVFQIDEDTWASAKPLFTTAANQFYTAGMEVKEIGRRIIARLKEGYNLTREALQEMMPYLTRFMEQVRDGVIKLGLEDRSDRVNEEVESDFSIQYSPKSNAFFSVGTLTPRNMQDAITEALNELEERVGDIDRYVANKLGYTLEEMAGTDEPGYFSAEQIDALALAIDNVESGGGFIIGDQTGVGKGRVVAGMIVYAIKNGRVPIFITKDKALYKAMVEDFRDIGRGDLVDRIYVTNNDLTGKDALPLSDDPLDKLTSLPAQRQTDVLDAIRAGGRLPPEYDVVFTNYSQLQYTRGVINPRMTALRELAHGSIIVMDESHEAAGSETRTIDKETGEPIPTRSDYIKEILGTAQGAVYSSATYAKNPHSMSLYFRTDISLAVDDVTQLTDAIKAGGVPLQQIVANMLVMSGQYVRRERSFDGVQFDAETVATNPTMAASSAQSMREIFALDVDYMEAVRESWADSIQGEGGGTFGDQAVGGDSADSVGFANVMHNITTQLLLSLKAPSIVEKAIAIHEAGEKPIIALSSTNAAILGDFLRARADLRVGDTVDIEFNTVLERYVRRLRRMKVEPASGARPYYHFLTDAEIIEHGGQDALDEYNRVEDFVKGLDLKGIPASPIDYIIDNMRAAGINMGEITGRQDILEEGIWTKRDASAAAKTRTMSQFNSGALDGLVINRSGSTGFSLHARDFGGNDGKVRHMIIAQPDANIDVFMQILGRIHRTGQSQLPKYTIALSDLEIEKRVAAILMQKMASLNANTTASAESAVSLDNVVNFFNRYGDEVVRQFLNENPEIDALLNIERGVKDKLAQKFTGRLAIVEPSIVGPIYADVEAAYTEKIAALDAAGMNTLAAKTLELDARRLDVVELVPERDGGGGSPFGAAASMETLDVRRLGKPYTMEQVQERLDAILGEKGATEFVEDSIAEVEAKLPEYIERTVRPGIERGEAALEAARTPVQEQKAQTTIDLWTQKGLTARLELDEITSLMRALEPGTPLVLQAQDQGVGVYIRAVSLGVSVNSVRENPSAPSAYKFRVAINESTPEITLPLSQFLGEDATWGHGEATMEEVTQHFETGVVETRETRQVITGNLLSGYSTFGRGEIIVFTRDDGSTNQGVLMPRAFDLDEELARRPVRFETTRQIHEFLTGDQHRIVATQDGVMNIQQTDEGFKVTIRRRGGQQYYLNRLARQHIQGGDFESQGRRGGGIFKGIVRGQSDLEAFIQVYDTLGTAFETHTHKDEARDIVGGPQSTRRQSRLSAQSVGGSPTGQTQALEEKFAAIRDDIIAKLEKLGVTNTVAVEVVGQLGGDPFIRGDYNAGLIRLALDTTFPDAMRTLSHEVLHALKDAGVFTSGEWFILEENARADKLRLARVRLDYKDQNLTEEELLEEVIADQFGELEGTPPTTAIGVIYKKIRDILKAIGAAFRGQGYKNAAQVLRDISNGTVGAREVSAAYEFSANQTFHEAALRAARQRFPGHTKFAEAREGARQSRLSRRRAREGRPAPESAKSVRRRMFPFLSDQKHAEFDDAKKGLADQRGIMERVGQSIKDHWHGISRHYKELPNSAQFAAVQQKLVQIESAPTAARQQVIRTLQNMIKDFDQADMEAFSWKVLIDDLSWEVEQEHDLPFNLSYEQLDQMRDGVEAELDARPYLRDAVRARLNVVQRVASEMVRSGVLSPEQARNPAYYRHQVLDYARAWTEVALSQKKSKSTVGGATGGDIRTPEWARRMGSKRAINLNLLEAEFEWMTRAMVDVTVADTLAFIKDSEHNTREELLSAARQSNRNLIEEMVDNDPGAEKQWTQFRQRLAFGFQGLADALENMTVPEQFQEAADSIISGVEHPDVNIFPLLTWMVETGVGDNRGGSGSAALVFNTINHRRAWTKVMLGDEYANTRDIRSLIERFGDPVNTMAFQPDSDNMIIYTASTIPEHAMNRFIDRVVAESQGDGLDPAVAQALRDEVHGDAKQLLAIGGEKYMMVLPTELALTLNSLHSTRDVGMLDILFATPMRKWKKWVLINPRRIVRYNLNNLSGDMDAVIAGKPKALLKMGPAVKELYAVMLRGEEPSQTYKDAVWRGVFDSGLTVQEISEINEFEGFNHIVEQKGELSTKRIMQLWRGMQRVTWFRENWLRYAAYLDYVERLEAGESQESIGYGASLPKIVDAVPDLKDRGALLARDLLGDYGRVSHYGMEIRRKYIPFWSWMEINTKRYWRLGSNGFSQGVLSGIGATTHAAASIGVRTAAFGVGKTSTLYLRMAILYGMVSLYNHLAYGDEEDELDPITRGRLHVNLGRTEDGKIQTLRFNGAVGDALDWFGWGDAVFMATEVEKGRAGYHDVVKAILKAPVNKLLNALTPVVKLPIELISGKRLYPDIFKPRQIRDRWRHLAQVFTLEHEYDALFNKPSRGYPESLREAVLTTRNPEENAYNEIRNLSYGYQERVSGRTFGGAFSPRSDAMYQWRTALKMGDTEAAKAARQRLRDMGVKAKDFKGLRKRAHPLANLSKVERRRFRATLDAGELRKLEKAKQFYRDVFYPRSNP